VLRLWPRTIRIGLFEQSATVSLRGTKVATLRTSLHATLESWLADLAALLPAASTELRKGDLVHLVVSDCFAAATTLPWHSSLSTEEELITYARLCFEKSDTRVDNTWVVQAYRPRWQAPGLAYALPCAAVTQLKVILDEKRAVLASVIPVSVAAFAAEHDMRRAPKSLHLLAEASRISCLVFEQGMLVSRDAEPAAESFEKGLNRLLMRSELTDDASTRATLWVSEEDQWEALETAMGSVWPNTPRHRAGWGR
jgi:hypothetical protein